MRGRVELLCKTGILRLKSHPWELLPTVLGVHQLRAQGMRLLILGSLGPGITPTKIIFSSLNRSSPGKFKIARCMTPTEYGECLKGWYQSTFIISGQQFLPEPHNFALTYWKSCQIFPSYTSPITASGMFRCLHCSHFSINPGLLTKFARVWMTFFNSRLVWDTGTLYHLG